MVRTWCLEPVTICAVLQKLLVFRKFLLMTNIGRTYKFELFIIRTTV